jgi:NAD(P)-dependent dehydrogenase (short-subunit alcohol dehydrogenase family)
MSYTRTVLITGGTSGVGYQAALVIARQHPESLVIIASRTDPNSVAASINNALRQKNVTFLSLDLSNFANIRTFAQHFSTSSYPAISHLILNAALQFTGKEIQKTTDGIETTFCVAHVGHALLFHLLFPFFAPTARVLVTTSGTHDPAERTGLPDAKYTSAEEIAHPSRESAKKNTGRQRYATAKLCNVLWTYALARRFEKLSGDGHAGGRKLTVVTFDPGLVPGTALAREASGIEKFLWRKVMPHILPLLRVLLGKNVHSGEEAGENMAFVVMSEEVGGTNGVYFQNHGEQKKSSEVSYEEGKQEELWAWTVKTVARDEEEMRKFDIGK